jgi:hypothetical protein
MNRSSSLFFQALIREDLKSIFINKPAILDQGIKNVSADLSRFIIKYTLLVRQKYFSYGNQNSTLYVEVWLRFVRS